MYSFVQNAKITSSQKPLESFHFVNVLTSRAYVCVCARAPVCVTIQFQYIIHISHSLFFSFSILPNAFFSRFLCRLRILLAGCRCALCTNRDVGWIVARRVYISVCMYHSTCFGRRMHGMQVPYTNLIERDGQRYENNNNLQKINKSINNKHELANGECCTFVNLVVVVAVHVSRSIIVSYCMNELSFVLPIVVWVSSSTTTNW